MSSLARKQHPASADDICSGTGNIRVELFSSRELHHAAFKYLLNAENGFQLECIAQTAVTDLDRLKQSRPDLAVIDLALLPGELLRSTKDMLSALCHLTSVILLVDQIDIYSLRTMIACGIHGYLLTSASLREFRQALQVVITGGHWLEQAAIQAPLSPCGASYVIAGNPIIRDLSHREREILKNVARGLTSKEIARTLCLSESSVRTYWYRVLSKLNALNKAEAIVRASRMGLLDFNSEKDADPPQLREMLL